MWLWTRLISSTLPVKTKSAASDLIFGILTKIFRPTKNQVCHKCIAINTFRGTYIVIERRTQPLDLNCFTRSLLENHNSLTDTFSLSMWQFGYFWHEMSPIVHLWRIGMKTDQNWTIPINQMNLFSKKNQFLGKNVCMTSF